jgi:hypothetical protein
MLDSCIWLAGTPGYPLSETQKVIVDMIMEDEGGGGAKHFDRPVLLPHDLDNYEGKYIISPCRPGIPATLPSWSQADEKKVLDSLIRELNDSLLAGLDPEPNLSRSSKRPQLYPAFRSGCVESAAFVGGSNARNLADAAANLGIDSYQLAKGGWKITRENIEKLIPDLKELMSSLPAGTPIILFCLDNSCFLAASEDGSLLPIPKCVQEDDGYHVKGDLVVAPECALQHALELLKKLVTELSEYQLFFVTPITSYIAGPCCNADDHVSNAGNPDFLSKILSDLTKLKFSLRKKLAPATVLDGIELICGPGCNKDRIEHTLRSGWVDPVHPKTHVYSKMALNLIEKVAAASIPVGSQKRKRSDSSEGGHSARAIGPPSRGGQSPRNRLPSNRGGSAVHSAPQPHGSNRADNSGNSLHSHMSWIPPRGRGQYQGRGVARGRGFAVERGRGNHRGGQPRRGWGQPWSRW